MLSIFAVYYPHVVSCMYRGFWCREDDKPCTDKNYTEFAVTGGELQIQDEFINVACIDMQGMIMYENYHWNIGASSVGVFVWLLWLIYFYILGPGSIHERCYKWSPECYNVGVWWSIAQSSYSITSKVISAYVRKSHRCSATRYWLTRACDTAM